MNFKDYLIKKIIPTYFMIVTLILFGMAAVGLILYRHRPIDVLTLFVPLVFGGIGCLPLLVDYLFSHRKNIRFGLLLYNAAELVMLEICILSAAFFVGIIDSIFTAVIIAVMVLCIFAAVGTVMYLQDRGFCDSINNALAQYDEKYDN